MRRIGIRILLLLLAALVAPGAAFANATLVIVNGNAPGVGFNDPTPVAPVGGNTGTTLGEQRLIAFRYAASLWGATLDSNVEIRVLATFEPLTCTATGAVLGSAGTAFIFRDFPANGPFPGAEFPSTWYHSALADKRVGVDLVPGEPDMRARFNSVIDGRPTCLGGTRWYLGLDNNHGADIDLVAVLLHEFAHGLGFAQFASVSTGAQIQGLTDVYGRRILDTTTNKYWSQMTDAERVASAVNPRRVVFDGPNVTAAVPSVLAAGTPLLTITAPAAIAGGYSVGAAAFGPPLSTAGVSGQVVLALDPANAAGPSTTDACSALTNAVAVAGRIALVDRGTCGFTVKVKNAQNAGAIAVIVADNVAGAPPAGLGGADATITIPAVRISLADGNAIRVQLAAGVFATLGVDLSRRAGADGLGRALLYTPTPVAPGSTISHWDTIATPNQLMEPAINADLTHSVRPPQDLTLPLMRDIGWFADGDVDGIEDSADQCQSSDLRPTVFIGGSDSGVSNVLFTTGCTIADLIGISAAGARNHGDFVSDVAHLSNALRDYGIISAQDKASLQRTAAQSPLP
jgi:hypothetical protein